MGLKYASKIAVVFLVLISLALTGCSTKYVCYDGTVENDQRDCPKIPITSLTQVQAQNVADNFGRAYSSALGASYHRINLFRAEGHWFAEVIFTTHRNGGINHVKLKIDGVSGSPSCIEGCEYLFGAYANVNISGNVNGDVVENVSSDEPIVRV